MPTATTERWLSYAKEVDQTLSSADGSWITDLRALRAVLGKFPSACTVEDIHLLWRLAGDTRHLSSIRLIAYSALGDADTCK